MSQPSRPRTRGPAERRQRSFILEQPVNLEERKLLTPFVVAAPDTVTYTPTTTGDTVSGPVVVTQNVVPATASTFESAAPLTSVAEFAPLSEFGGDIVRIEAGPGGDFGQDVYAITRGPGENPNAIDDPGVIYRLDPATGQASVFFDLNSVVSQLEPTATPGNSVGSATGLVNWYDLSFDPEGYFDGTPSLFVASVDRSDPAKNAIYQISSAGKLLAVFADFTDGASAGRFTSNPSAILVPPVEQQSFLRGLLAGSGLGASTIAATTFSAFFFNANEYRPGQNISTATLPFGISQTNLTLGPQTSLTAANTDYISSVYSTFADFGTPAAGGIPAEPGLSGVQGINGELLINQGVFPTTPTTAIDTYPAISTEFRRFEDSAFDYYGYFSQGMTVAQATTTTGTGGTGTGTGGGSGTGTATGNTFTFGGPVYVGSLFVADLGTGLAISVANPVTAADPTLLPVQGSGTATVVYNATTGVPTSIETPGGNDGGRIVRISPTGAVTPFAEGFDTSGALDSSSFVDSSLSITFSADGTTLYASDDDAIWEFKTVTDLASSTSGSLIGLNDLRTLGVPYQGQDTAVAVVDTGVDASNPDFRGKVATGTNVITGGPGNLDTAAISNATANNNNGGGTGGSGGTTGGQSVGVTQFGHGTLLAGVVAQLVPQATIVPVDVFDPFVLPSTTTTTTGGGTGGSSGTTVTASSNGVTTSQQVYEGLQYVSSHPYVADPVRPGQFDRVTNVLLGFGTTETFASEEDAFKRYPQVVISLKNDMTLLRRRGIQPIAAAGQFGAPFAAGTSTTTGTTTTTTAQGDNNSENTNVGDVNGMSLPAALNEVTSVTGLIPFPFSTGPGYFPGQPPQAVFPQGVGPVLVFGNSTTTPGGSGTQGNTGTGTGTTTTGTNDLVQLTNGNQAFGTGTGTGTGGGTGATTTTTGAIFYTDRILAAANRSLTTDYAAPAIDVPTFGRTFAGNLFEANYFVGGGTSLSAAIVSGAFDLVSSALQYWSTLNKTGVTTDAYLTTPVGVTTLNFGPRALKDFTAYNNPDGINSILEWTAVPATDANDGLSQSTPPMMFGSTSFRNYSQISVSNAIAAIEGEVAIQYLLKHNDFNIIDTNHDGLVTAQEVQTFVDDSAAMGLPEAGAMAALLGGTARIPDNVTPTLAGESPDQPDVEQRRFNFFDYVADGQLNGAISINQFKLLAHELLPTPTSFSVVDRQRSSGDGYLVNPNVPRNYKDLQHVLPSFEFVPKSAVAKYKGVSPDRFGVNRNVVQTDGVFPVYTLFTGKAGTTTTSKGTTTSTSTTTGSAATTGSGSTSGSSASSPTFNVTPVTIAAATGTTPTTTTSAPASTTSTPTSTTPTPTTTTTTTGNTGSTTPSTTPAQGSTTTSTTGSSTTSQTTVAAALNQLASTLAANQPQTAGSLSSTPTPTPTPVATPTPTPTPVATTPSVGTTLAPAQPITAPTPATTPVPAAVTPPVASVSASQVASVAAAPAKAAAKAAAKAPAPKKSVWDNIADTFKNIF
jgi:hypothetical protein